MVQSRNSGDRSTAGFEIERNDRLLRRYAVLALAVVMVALVALGSLSVYVTGSLAIGALERQFGDLKPALEGLQQQVPESRAGPLAPQGAYRAVLAAQQKTIQENKPAVGTPQQQIQKDRAGLAVPEQQSQENRSAVAVAGQDSSAAGAVTPGALAPAQQDSFTAAAVTPGTLAPPARTVYRIGILSTAAASDLAGPQPRSASALAFLRGMRERGYAYGEHFVTEVRG